MTPSTQDGTTAPGAASTAAGAAANIPIALIDMHCHVFNATDLPASQFIYRVVRQRYNADPDGLVLGLGAILSALAGNAPTPVDELADIARGRPSPNAASAVGASGTGGILDWLKLFGHSRRELIARLGGFYSATNNHCELITPAMVDYNCWLDQPENQGQRPTDQVAVMGAIAKLPGTPRVHGFVGFDPVRAILAANGYNPSGGTALDPIDPHELLRDAVNNHGFLGVKLYPPMGFRAWQNGKGDITFSTIVKKYVGVALNKPNNTIEDRELGQLINAELEKLYRYCASEGVPILAHAYNSNQADECTGWRASPQYWGEVIDNFSSPQKPLRLCLGHFGSFSAHLKFPACHDAFDAKAWETIIGGILTSAKAPYVFADVSYLSEVLDDSAAGHLQRKKMSDQFKSFIGKYDQQAEHICYGSDWIMLGLESGHQRYHVALGDFLRKDVALNAVQLNNIYFGNATRFLGLQPGDQNRARLEKFYRDNNIQNLFPHIDALVA